MDSIQSFNHGNKLYLSMEGIRQSGFNESYFTGCKSNRKCIEKHCIPETVCLYVKNGSVYTKNYKPADLYIERHYAKANIIDASVYDSQRKASLEDKKKQRDCKAVERKKHDETTIFPLPPVVHIDTVEMFRDENDNQLSIEIVGAKQWDQAYFKAIDIGKAFGILRISMTILQRESKYVYGEDYTFFLIDRINYAGDTNIKELYLTYMGVMKVLFASRGNSAMRFQKWGACILFGVQMGDTDARQRVAADALHVSQAAITKMFRKSVARVSCVYLFEIGRVGDLRGNVDGLSLFHNDDAIVYKYGMTSDMARRSEEHGRYYGKMNGSDFKLALFSNIDEVYVSKAESCLKRHFDMMKVHVNGTEHIVVDKYQKSYIKEIYTNIYRQYSGSNGELISQVQELQHEIEMLKKDAEISKMVYEKELLRKDNEFQQKELTLLRRSVGV